MKIFNSVMHNKTPYGSRTEENTATNMESGNSQRTRWSVSAFTVQTILALIVLQLPVIGYCDSGSGFFSGLFESKGKNMKEVATKIATLSEENDILGLDFSPDGKHLAATPFDAATVHIWDWQGNRLERTLEREKGTNVNVTEPVRYSPDGKLLAICHDKSDQNIIARIWNTDTWDVVRDIVEPGSARCEAIEFTSDGKSLIRVMAHSAVGFTGNNLVVYATSTWQPTWDLNTQPFLPSTLSISPDSKFFAIGGGSINGFNAPVPIQAQVSIVDMAQRKIVRTIQLQRSEIIEHRRVAWSPDGERLAYAGRYGVEIFDTRSWGRVTNEPSEGKGRQIHIRYTSDGKYFIESGFGNEGARVRIWDGQHRELLQEIKAIPGCIAVSRDGRYLAMGGDKKIIVWQLK
jgi:WD40 repeat protein